MASRSKKLQWEEYEAVTALPLVHRQLLELAVHSLQKAYAPYSGFWVGASVLLSNGESLGGANQENAVYPLCLCAEQVVLAAAKTRFPNETIQMMAITVCSQKQLIDQPVMPCGGCRQVMSEMTIRQKAPFPLVIRGEMGPVWVFADATDLLPFSFNADYL